MRTILLINGSPQGKKSNTGLVFQKIEKYLSNQFKVIQIHLTEAPPWAEIKNEFQAAHGFIFGTGTYWDSWGSPLQKFLEDASQSEATKAWLGKPAAVVVLMHSVGGKEVLSRLQGVLNTFGVAIPPLSGMVFSTVNQIALQTGESEWSEDLWHFEDWEIICHNLIEAMNGTNNWKTWPADRTKYESIWLDPSS